MKQIITNKYNLTDSDMTEIVKRVKILIINSKNEILLAYSHNDYQFPGGHVEENETLIQAINREVLEETGIELKSYKLRCIVTYVSTTWETEYMYVFTSNEFEGNLIECDEGDLQWIDKNKISQLHTWEGDKIFLEKIQKDNSFFTVKFEYDGEKLVKYTLKEY